MTMVDKLADLLAELRPDWADDRGLIKVVLLAHASKVAACDLATAAVRAAADPLNSVKVIGWRGPHWDGLATGPHVHPRLRCRVCDQLEDRCYRSQRLVDDPEARHDFDPIHPAPLR